ncbi:uncharacterized protein UDID_19286 [Ustilago sp. UG-2017a]|nr:uncharacterized protein UDID_19286 [Ustilago sp. UG-2017a]
MCVVSPSDVNCRWCLSTLVVQSFTVGGVAQHLQSSQLLRATAYTSKLSVAPTPTAREFIFDLTAAAGDGLIITGPSFANAAAAHRGLPTSSSAASHLISVDVSFSNDAHLTADGNEADGGIDIVQPHTLAWAGAPDELQPTVWQLLLSYPSASVPILPCSYDDRRLPAAALSHRRSSANFSLRPCILSHHGQHLILIAVGRVSYPTMKLFVKLLDNHNGQQDSKVIDVLETVGKGRSIIRIGCWLVMCTAKTEQIERNVWRRNCIKNTYYARKSMTSKALHSAHETYGNGEMDPHLYTDVATMDKLTIQATIGGATKTFAQQTRQTLTTDGDQPMDEVQVVGQPNAAETVSMVSHGSPVAVSDTPVKKLDDLKSCFRFICVPGYEIRNTLDDSKAAARFAVFAKDLEISDQDDMCYCLVRLANGLEALVTQDPKTDKPSAATANTNTGLTSATLSSATCLPDSNNMMECSNIPFPITLIEKLIKWQSIHDKNLLISKDHNEVAQLSKLMFHFKEKSDLANEASIHAWVEQAFVGGGSIVKFINVLLQRTQEARKPGRRGAATRAAQDDPTDMGPSDVVMATALEKVYSRLVVADSAAHMTQGALTSTFSANNGVHRHPHKLTNGELPDPHCYFGIHSASTPSQAGTSVLWQGAISVKEEAAFQVHKANHSDLCIAIFSDLSTIIISTEAASYADIWKDALDDISYSSEGSPQLNDHQIHLRSTQMHWFGHCTHRTILILDEVIHSNLIVFIDENVTTICLVKTMEAAKAKETSNFTKQVKPGITYLAPTATNMATAETIVEHKAMSNSALMGMIHNTRRWLSRTPMEVVPEGQLTPTCQSHLARDQPQQPTCPPQQHPHPTWRPCHNCRPLEQRTITALEAALSDPIDLLMDPGSTISMLPTLRMEAIMTRPGCI